MGQYKKEDYLRERFVENRESVEDIAEDFDITPQGVHYWIKKHDISRRPEELYDDDWLHQKYWDEELSTTEIGNILDVDSGVVSYWMEKAGVDRRTVSKAREGAEFSNEHIENLSKALEGAVTGEDHPQWSGGYKDKYYGSNWTEQRRAVLKRDECCISCGSDEDLVVHHKTEIRMFRMWDLSLEDANVLRNLVTLCRPCHSTLHAHPKGEKLINTRTE